MVCTCKKWINCPHYIRGKSFYPPKVKPTIETTLVPVRWDAGALAYSNKVRSNHRGLTPTPPPGLFNNGPSVKQGEEWHVVNKPLTPDIYKYHWSIWKTGRTPVPSPSPIPAPFRDLGTPCRTPGARSAPPPHYRYTPTPEIPIDPPQFRIGSSVRCTPTNFRLTPQPPTPVPATPPLLARKPSRPQSRVPAATAIVETPVPNPCSPPPLPASPSRTPSVRKPVQQGETADVTDQTELPAEVPPYSPAPTTPIATPEPTFRFQIDNILNPTLEPVPPTPDVPTKHPEVPPRVEVTPEPNVPFKRQFNAWVTAASDKDKRVVYDLFKTLTKGQPARKERPKTAGARTRALHPFEIARKAAMSSHAPGGKVTYYVPAPAPAPRKLKPTPSGEAFVNSQTCFMNASKPHRGHFVVNPEWVSENKGTRKVMTYTVTSPNGLRYSSP